MYRYLTEKEELFSEDLGTYTSFGIRIYQESQELSFISDISPDAKYVRDLAQRCTEHQLDPIHFFDIIENET